MQQENKKYIYSGFFVIGFFSWLILKGILSSILDLIKIQDYYIGSIATTNIFSILVGITVIVLLVKNVTINVFADEVTNELKKITWPGKKETSGSTVVVIILILIGMLVLGVFDLIWVKLIQLLL
jgi:preprotein translocase SecE subunit